MISCTKNAMNIVRNLFISIAALCPALVLRRMARYPNYDPSARFLGQPLKTLLFPGHSLSIVCRPEFCNL